MRQIDGIDLKILRLLQDDGRITNADLAKAIQLSPPSTLHRVRQLEEAGIIRGYSAQIDAERLGLKLTILCMITLSLHQERAIERFVRSVQEIPEVVECYNTSGSTDYFLKILVKDMKHYESLVRERLSRISGVGHINSSFVLAKHKQTSTVPL